MKVFFNHLTKCGGSSLNRIAVNEYKHQFHVLSKRTSAAEVESWLAGPRCFITSEINPVEPSILELLYSDTDLKKIILARDPVERFISFCGHSTRDKRGPRCGASYWGHENNIKQVMTSSGWLRSSLNRVNLVLQGHDTHLLGDADIGWTFPVYSQWMMATFKSCPQGLGELDHALCDVSHPRDHIRLWRKKQNIYSCINRYVESNYFICGTLDQFDLFVRTLCASGIFSEQKLGNVVSRANSSMQVRRERPDDFFVSEELIAEFYSLLPEDFYFNTICKNLLARRSGSLA